MHQVLALDIAGNPFHWLDINRAAYYLAAGKVAWSLGKDVAVLRGGYDRDGARSVLEVPSVIALAKSERMVAHLKDDMPLGEGNLLLYRRDRGICAYCGEHVPAREATRDHVFPRARGGRDVWENVVLAHRYCNMKKACRTPDEASMPLYFIPYRPCRAEHFILSGRRILADQHEYLRARIRPGSRLLI